MLHGPSVSTDDRKIVRDLPPPPTARRPFWRGSDQADPNRAHYRTDRSGRSVRHFGARSLLAALAAVGQTVTRRCGPFCHRRYRHPAAGRPGPTRRCISTVPICRTGWWTVFWPMTARRGGPHRTARMAGHDGRSGWGAGPDGLDHPPRPDRRDQHRVDPDRTVADPVRRSADGTGIGFVQAIRERHLDEPPARAAFAATLSDETIASALSRGPRRKRIWPDAPRPT